MCLILFSFAPDSEYPVIVAANRDEFYARPTQKAHFWDDAPHIVAGRDCISRGTWLGADRYGRFAAVANYRDPSSDVQDARSRGWLVSDYLMGNTSSEAYLNDVQTIRHRFNGFNLIVGDATRIFYLSGRTGTVRRLSAGLFGLSNDALDTPWPKVVRGKAGIRRLLDAPGSLEPAALFGVLADTRLPRDSDLPNTGVGIDWERILAPIFVQSPTYGTRCSTVLTISQGGVANFTERSFDANGYTTKTVTEQFQIVDRPSVSTNGR